MITNKMLRTNFGLLKITLEKTGSSIREMGRKYRPMGAYYVIGVEVTSDFGKWETHVGGNNPADMEYFLLQLLSEKRQRDEENR